MDTSQKPLCSIVGLQGCQLIVNRSPKESSVLVIFRGAHYRNPGLTMPPTLNCPCEIEWSAQLVARLQQARLQPALAAELSARCTTLTGLELKAPVTVVDHAHMLWLGCSRGHALIAQALAWKHASVGSNKKAKPSDTARGGLWRYVMAYSGWEQIAKAVCWRGPGDDKLHPDRLQALCEGLHYPAPTWSTRHGCPNGLQTWIGECEEQAAHVQTFLGLNRNHLSAFRCWLRGEAGDEAALLRLLAIQRNLVVHGALSPTRARTWKLLPAYEHGVGLLAQLSQRVWGVLWAA